MMWEIIQANKRRSLVLLAAMAVCLLGLGYAMGYVLGGPEGGTGGLLLAGVLWAILLMVSYSSGPSILLASSHAREVTPEMAPQLFNVVEEMKIAANLPAMPKVYVIDEPAMNAFATGLSPERSAVAVTAGLLSRLNRDELQGVVAHEISHILNRDVRYMTLAGVMLGSIQILTQTFLRGMWYSGRSSRYRSSRSSSGGNQAQMILFLVAIVFAIVGPLLARIFYFSLSRRREYLADASGARLTRYPEGLASALEKISGSTVKLEAANDATNPFFISDPSGKTQALFELAATHPPIEKRIRILRSMQGAGFSNYAGAYEKIFGKGAGILPPSALAEKESPQIRQPSADSGTGFETLKGQKRDARDMMRALNGFLFLVCACGLKIKVDREDKRREFRCPRCSRSVSLPQAGLAVLGGVLEGIPEAAPKPGMEEDRVLVYHRKTTGWETFSCTCGHTLQLSPAFNGSHLECRACGRRVLIENPRSPAAV